MACGEPAIIGASWEDKICYGETIDLILNFENEDGTPIDLSTSTVTVVSSTPAIIQAAAEITITDALAGEVRFLLHAADALSLRRGVNNRFQLRTVFGVDSDDVTPDIYLQVS